MNNNYKGLAKFHLGISIFYTLLIIGFYYFLEIFLWPLLIIPLMHFLLIFGSLKQNEFSRKTSVVLGVLMIGAFPIGTIMAMYFLPLTDWKIKDSK